MNQNESIEKLLAEVQLRQPELDVETLLRKAAESEGSVTRCEQVARVRRKRCFCRWATLTGIWASGLAIGILVMYLYTNNSLQRVQDELQTMRAKLALQSRDTDQLSPSVANQPTESPSNSRDRSLCQNGSSPCFRSPNQLLDRLIGPCADGDEPVYAMAYASLARRNAYYTTYAQPSWDEENESRTNVSRPHKPKSPKTQQQLVQELLGQFS